MSEQTDLLEALMFFAESVRTSMLYMTRRVEALEASAARRDPFFSIPDLTDEEDAAWIQAKEALAKELRS